jgi:general secretion pathway protein L
MNLPEIGAAAAAGWTWWIGELRGCVPRRLRTLMAPSTLRLDISADGVTLRRSSRSARIFPLPFSAEDREALALQLRRRHTAVVFEPGRALVVPVELPLAAERAIPAALRFEVDRCTPFKASSVHLGFRIRERDTAGRKLKVDMVCVPKRLLDPVREVLHIAGATLDSIAVELGAEKSGAVRVELTQDSDPRHSGRQAATRLSHAATFASVLGIGMVIAGLLIPLFRLESMADSYESDVAGLRTQAAKAVELENRLTEIATREAALDTFLSGTAPVVLLAELARVAADDTHFTAFRFDGGTINVDGHGASAAALAEVIEGSPLFRNPTFRAAVTPASNGGEQFSLGFEVEGDTRTASVQPAARLPAQHPQLEHRTNRRPEAR